MQIKYFKLLLIAFTIQLTPSLIATNGWSPEAKEQVEYNAINLEIAKINEYFTSIGGYRSSARQNAIFDLLKKINTPVSYKILRELVENGTLPKEYLNRT